MLGEIVAAGKDKDDALCRYLAVEVESGCHSDYGEKKCSAKQQCAWRPFDKGPPTFIRVCHRVLESRYVLRVHGYDGVSPQGSQRHRSHLEQIARHAASSLSDADDGTRLSERSSDDSDMKLDANKNACY